jgi:hypothetical protein
MPILMTRYGWECEGGVGTHSPTKEVEKKISHGVKI